jgi:hypothetical protein
MAVTIVISGQREVRLDGDAFSVGRDPSCSIPLPGDDRLEPQHAVIRRVAGRWMVESKGSGLIQVGEGRPTQMSWLNPGDLIRLTAAGPDLTFDPQPAAEIGAPATPVAAAAVPMAKLAAPDVRRATEDRSNNAALAEPSRPSAPHMKQPLWWAAGGAGLLAAGTLLAVFVFWLSGTFQRQTAGEPNDSNENSDVVAADVEGNSETRSSTGGRSPAAAAGTAEPNAAVYLVTVVAGNDGATYRLGTAWAVSKRQLITSGAIAAGLESLADVAPRSRVVSPQGGQSFSIRSRRLHPRYQAALQESRRAQSDAESVRLDLEKVKNQSQIDTLTEKLIAAEERRYQALERQVDCDLALLEIDGELPKTLAIAGQGVSPLKAGSKVTLCGVPFKQQDYVADPDAVLRSVTAPGNLLAGAMAASNAPRRWLVRCAREFGSENWSGAPVLDSRGQVVGVYSRPTPPPPGRDELPAIVTHDITDVSAALELLR